MAKKIKQFSKDLELDLLSLENLTRQIESRPEREKALSDIESFRRDIQIKEQEIQEIHLRTNPNLPPTKLSWLKLLFLTLLFALLAYVFGIMALFQVLDMGSYTEKSTGQLITALGSPIKYWGAVIFFASGALFSLLMTLGCIAALITYPVPPLQRYREFKSKKSPARV